MTKEQKEIHNEAARLCKEVKALIERITEEDRLEDTEYCEEQVNELESKYSTQAVIYMIENCYKPFKVVADDDGKYTIRSFVWYNISDCNQNTLLRTAMKLHKFLKQNELI